MNPLKKLAGQTVIYGLPSIIGRMLGYLLVPIYTRVFDQGEYGTVTLFYSFVAVIFIILTYGMETAFFRFSELEKNKKNVFNTVFISLLITTSIFLVFTIIYSQDIANWIKYPGQKNYVIWFLIILSLDTLACIPFAKLRAQNKAKRFATIKIINIITNICLNLFFILLCPYILKNYHSGIIFKFINVVFNPDLNLIAYVFISNLLASALTLILLLPDIFVLRFRFNINLWKRLIYYAFPLLFAGLAGVMNETGGRILIRYLLPEDIAEQQLGIYAACFKIAIFMALFIQAFRYAAEPFFFSYAKEKDSKKIYADLMTYFVLVASFIFLAIMMYIDIVIHFIGEEFREGASVIPILLLAYLFLGIFYNLSIWYKLTNNTKFGAFLAIFGAVVTISLNIYWIPRLGYIGSAWATFLCYGSMMVLSFLLSKKYYPVKYNFKRITGYIGLSVVLFLISKFLNIEQHALKLIINTIFLLIFLAVVYFIEKPGFKKIFR
ncbi:MAG: polysaccharide biosynthesis C-terminal domain-containing protein [Bacteroidales bacterium]|nr:polysaccharide biosynthesis C-terminal domain-containing protein [Bacteroidales bacterium]